MYCFQQHRQSNRISASLWQAVTAGVLAAALSACGPSPGDEAAANDGDAPDTTATDSASTDSASTDSGSAIADSTVSDSVAAKLRDSVPVETAAAHKGDISSYLVFSSTVETEAAVEIHPEVSGQVEAVLVEEGDQVAAGDLLVALDNDQARLEDRESASNLRYLEGSFDRTDEMYKRKLISEQAYEDKLHELEQARMRQERASLALTHTEIRAPFSGVLTSRQVQVGARVAPGAKLFDLIKLDDMIARVHVPGRYMRTVRVGQVAEVESDFIEDMLFAGYVKRISPIVDPSSGTFKVTVGLRDRWQHLRPGIFVNVRVVIDTHEDAILIPKEAVIYDGSDRYVFVVADSTAQRIQLDAGYENGHFIEARSAILAGTPVIVVGQNGLKDQARVKVVNAAEDPAPAAPAQG
jgi:membrane fusion protein, multidrug efflux system